MYREPSWSFTEEQAEGVAELLNETDAACATKDDLRAVEARVSEQLAHLRTQPRLQQTPDSRIVGYSAEYWNARFDRFEAEVKGHIASRGGAAVLLLALHLTLLECLL